MLRYLLMAVFIARTVLALSNPQECQNNSGTLPMAVRISNCTKAPCVLQLGGTLIIEVDFKADPVLEKPVARMWMEALGWSGEYELPAEDANVCTNVKRTSCGVLTYNLNFLMDSSFPIIDLAVEILIEDAGASISCFKFPALTAN